MTSFLLHRREQGIRVTVSKQEVQDPGWAVVRDGLICKHGKIVPALAAMILASQKPRGQIFIPSDLMEAEWLAYPTPFRWGSLPDTPEGLDEFLLNPTRIWLDSLLRALADFAEHPDPVVVRDTAEASGLGEWLRQALIGPASPREDPPIAGLSEGFLMAWKERRDRIEKGRMELREVLGRMLRTSGRGIAEGSPVEVLRVARLDDGFVLTRNSPFDPSLKSPPQANETRVAIVRLGGSTEGQAFWLGYHIAPVVVVVLDRGARVGFHNIWVAARPAEVVKDFDGEAAAIRFVLDELTGGGVR